MDRVNEVINNWDPIDLFPLAPSDEYSSEIKQIFEVVAQNPAISTKELAVEIEKIFIGAFGRDIFLRDFEECIIIAKKILLEN